MESSPSVESFADHDSPFQSECLATALELHEVLRNEAEILRRFAGAELLQLVPKKEYLVTELEWKLEAAREATGSPFTVSDSFKTLLGEIGKLNASNGVFIERSLSYWQDFLSIFSPPSYGPANNKASRSARSPRGATFKREV